MDGESSGLESGRSICRYGRPAARPTRHQTSARRGAEEEDPEGNGLRSAAVGVADFEPLHVGPTSAGLAGSDPILAAPTSADPVPC